MTMFIFRSEKLNLITEGSSKQNHAANLWTCFLHKAFLHEVSSEFRHQLQEEKNKKLSEMKASRKTEV